MDELFDHLKHRIELLLQQDGRLKQANAVLKQDNSLLLEKHQKAIAQIENMVLRLKSIEKSQ